MNIMIDVETTGVEAGCCILTLAAVPFLVHSPIESFYDRASHQSSLQAGFTDNPDTIAWWDKQKSEIQDEAFGGTLSIHRMLESFCSYMATLGDPKDLHVWGNGKDFDQVILAHALKKLHFKQPWSFRNNWCYRDLIKMWPIIPKPENMSAHSALSDAKCQALHAELTIEAVRRGYPAIFPS